MKIITDKNGYSSVTLRWKKGENPALEQWLNAHQKRGLAVRALEILLESPGVRAEKIQAMIAQKLLEVQEFLDTVGIPVLTSEYEKQHNQKERSPADVDTVGNAAGVDEEGEVWEHRKVLLEF